MIRQIEATEHICNMILQLVCTAICDKGGGRDFNQELVKEVSNTNDMDVSKFREIGSEIASKLCIYSEETEKEHTKGASTDSKKRVNSLVTVYSLIIRFYAYIGDIDNAIRQLQKIREFARQRIVHRMYFPIISNHPSRTVEDLNRIMSLFMDGINEPNMTFDKETDYMTMLGKINAVYKASRNEAELGTFRSPIRAVLREMENNVSKVSPAFVEYIRSHMGAFLDINAPPGAAKVPPSGLDTNSFLAEIGNDGICPCCSTQLRSIDLKNNERKSIVDSVAADLAKEDNAKKKKRSQGNKEFKKKDYKKDKSFHELFQHFQTYLEKNGGDIDIIIDGANVGYSDVRFNPNSNLNVSVRHSQINAVIDHFKSQGKKILLILHARHFQQVRLKLKYGDNFDQRSSISAKSIRYFKKWENECLFYHTPYGMNDDWFWLYACLSESKSGRQPLVITNDMMRDHHFKLLSQNAFLNWRERHVVNYYFTKCPGRTQDPVPTFFFPQSYSTRIQSDSSNQDCLRYHFPVIVSDKKEISIEDADSLSSEFPTAEEIMRNHENKAVSTRWACVVEKSLT